MATTFDDSVLSYAHLCNPPNIPVRQPSRSVDVEVNLKDFDGDSRRVQLSEIAVPVTFEYLSNCLADQGFKVPRIMVVDREGHRLHVTDGPSVYRVGQGGCINIDQPLFHFYNKCYLPAITAYKSSRSDGRSADSAETASQINEATIGSDKTDINVGGVELSFRRTIRVPDNNKTHALPPDMGAFPIYNVADFADRLPESVVSKGGVFISMYQREAMWVYFDTGGWSKTISPHAVKISVGGVNALTGLSQDAPSKGKQDYLAINGSTGQMYVHKLLCKEN